MSSLPPDQPGTATHHTAVAMATAARRLVNALTDHQVRMVCRPWSDPGRTRWTYLPRPRLGASLLNLGEAARKAAHRLLGTALSRHAFRSGGDDHGAGGGPRRR